MSEDKGVERVLQRSLPSGGAHPARSRPVSRTGWRLSAVVVVIVAIAASYLVIHRGRNTQPVAVHLSAAPASVLPGSDGTNCGSFAVRAEISGQPPAGLMTCVGMANNKTPQVLSVAVGQTVSIAGLSVADRNGLLLTDTPALVSVDDADRQVTALAAGRARVQLHSKLLCPLAGNLCTLVILNVS